VTRPSLSDPSAIESPLTRGDQHQPIGFRVKTPAKRGTLDRAIAVVIRSAPAVVLGVCFTLIGWLIIGSYAPSSHRTRYISHEPAPPPARRR
jgi:hypothetical protein